MVIWVRELVSTDSAAPEELEEASHGGRLAAKGQRAASIEDSVLLSPLYLVVWVWVCMFARACMHYMRV